MSMSHRAQRMAQHHLRHRADAQLNLIPLIDILSVMVASCSCTRPRSKSSRTPKDRDSAVDR